MPARAVWEVATRVLSDLALCVLDKFVQLAAIQLHPSTFWTVVNLYSLTLRHHQIRFFTYWTLHSLLHQLNTLNLLTIASSPCASSRAMHSDLLGWRVRAAAAIGAARCGFMSLACVRGASPPTRTSAVRAARSAMWQSTSHPPLLSPAGA